ncbi:MAG TPA: lysophospholipid acyltransferase family protein [Geminicoccaceae bacterium]|nr:lysophospholipid acyltransferase family protein [Geminicoccaceae bacterium]
MSEPTSVTAGRVESSPTLVARSLAFNLAFWLWTGVMVVAVLPLLPCPRRAMVAAGRMWQRGVQRLLAALADLSYEMRGRERIPTTPAIFAFKHQSAWETLVLHLVLKDPAIALKRELTQIPLFGWYLTRAGMIRIDRAGGARALRSLVEDSRAALARGSEIVIFPEGTRAPVGGRNPYHPGVAALYLQLKCPVVPVALNSGVFWPRRSFLKRPGRIALEFLAPIEPGLDRKRFMAELEQRLEAATERLIAEARPGRLAA